MARMRGIAAPCAALPSVRLPRVALPACGWRLPRVAAGGGTDPVEEAVMSALVLWYDPRRQGATNESMAADPRLIDLSGNGHDATCYNFAWSGMSGIGGYKTNYTEYYIQNYVGTLEVTDTKIVIKNVVNNEALIETRNTTLGLIPAYKIKVSGIPDGALLRYVYFLEESNTTGQFYNILSDGEYELPANTYLNKYVGFRVSNFVGDCNITIEQLPLYPNALISDGVDDFARTQGFIIPDNKFTILFDIDWIDTRNMNAGITKSLSWWIYNRNLDNKLTILIQDPDSPIIINNDIFALSSNGNIYHKDSTITEFTDRGYRESTTNDIVFFTNTNINYYTKMVLRKFLLFDRELTTDEIEWVKNNLIEAEEEENDTLDESLVDAWIFSGLRNEDAPDSIVGEKGTPLICYNFAWNEDGSGFKDGALYFDGVDDYLSNDIFPILTDFTVICKREIYGMNQWSAVASKSNKKTDESAKGAFEFEWTSIAASTYPNRARSFGGAICNLNQDDIPELVSWMTKSSYNGILIYPGSSEDGDILSIGRLRNENFHCRMSIYWFALYSRSLTKEEINKEIEKLERIYCNRLNSN